MGVGTFGVLREAVYIPSVPSSYDKNTFLKKSSKVYCSHNQESISIFDDKNVQIFAVKTLKKSQPDVEEKILPNEIINLIKLH